MPNLTSNLSPPHHHTPHSPLTINSQSNPTPLQQRWLQSSRMHGPPRIDMRSEEDENDADLESSHDMQLQVLRRDDTKKHVSFDIMGEHHAPGANNSNASSPSAIAPRRNLEKSTRERVLVRQSSLGSTLAFDMASTPDSPPKKRKSQSLDSPHPDEMLHQEEKQRNELDLDFYQSLLVPSTEQGDGNSRHHGKRIRSTASGAMQFQKRDPDSIIAMIRKQQEQREKLFSDDKANPSSWKQVWSAKWKQKMAKRNADVELYESSKFSELDFIHQFDEIMQLVVSGRIKLHSNDEREEFQTHMFQMKRFIDENLRQNRVQNQLLRGKLKRREQLLEEQRKKYHHELILLREELFRKKQDENYNPTDYSLNDWNANVLNDMWPQEQKEAEEAFAKNGMESSTHASDSAKSGSNSTQEEKMIYDTLKKQSEQVTETLEKLKKLENKRKEELEELKRKQEETDRLKQQLEEKAEELKNLPLQRPPTSGGKHRSSASRRLSATSVGSNEQPSLRKRSSNATSVFSETEDMLNDLDTHLNARLSATSDMIRDDLDAALQAQESAEAQDERMRSQMLLSREVAEFVDDPSIEPADTSIDVLEDEISNFQGQFKNLYQQMYNVKERLQFYQKEVKEQEAKKPSMEDGPTGFVTLIFTDVESSTSLWELSSEEMMNAIKLHNEVILRLIEETGCYFVKVEGDAFMIASGDVFQSVLLAMRIQEELLKADWSEKLLSFEPTKAHYAEDGRLLWRGLRVRIGMHAGEPYVEKDPVRGFTDYFGNDVNKAARIEGCAKGGQVAISSVVYEHIKDRLDEFPIPVECTFYGSVALKGIKGEEKVYLITPTSLKDRPYRTPEPKEESEEPQGMMDLQSQLKYLEEKHNALENDRLSIQKKIRFQMKIQTLEDAMKEKDAAIIRLRKRLQKVKQRYDDADKSNDERKKRESRRQNTEIQSEIASTMEKYSQMVDEYNTMKENYDHVVNVFNSRLKKEMDHFKKELRIMRAAVESKEMQRYSDRKIFEMERDRFVAILANKERVIKQQAQHIGSLEQRLLNVELAKRSGGGHALIQGRPQSSPAARHPSIHMTQRRFNKEIGILEQEGSFHDVAAVLKEAIREAIQKSSANKNVSTIEDEDAAHSDPMRVDEGRGGYSSRSYSSVASRMLSSRKKKLSTTNSRPHSRSTKRSNSALSIPHGGSITHESSTNSLMTIQTSRSRPQSKRRKRSASSSRTIGGTDQSRIDQSITAGSEVDSRPERPLHTAFDGAQSNSRLSMNSDYSVMSGYSQQSNSRPSTTHTLQRYLTQRSRSATPMMAQAKVVGGQQEEHSMPLERTDSQASLRTPVTRRPQSRQSPYHVVTATQSNKKFPPWLEEESTPQSRYIRTSFSRLLRTAPVKHRTGNGQFSATVTVRGKATNRSKSVPPPPLPVDLIHAGDSGNESRTVRKLLKIVARGRRAESTEPILQNAPYDPHRQFVQDSQSVLKNFYQKRYGESVQYDSTEVAPSVDVQQRASSRFQSAFDDDYHSKIAAMRRLITQEMETRMRR